MNGAGQPEFGFDAFNPIDEPSEGSVISQAFHGRSERNEMMDTERSDMFDLIDLFHNRDSRTGQSGVSTNQRGSVMPSEFPSTY